MSYPLDTKAISALNKAVLDKFNVELEGQPSYADKLCSVINVSTNATDFPFLDDLGDGMNEWVSGSNKKIEKLEGGSTTLTTKDYEKSLRIRVRDVEDDNLGLYDAKISSLAQNVKTNPEKLIASKLVSGTTDLCFDGTAFFGNSHPCIDATTYDNLGSASLGADGLNTTITAMMKFKGRNGQVLNIVPDTLIVPPDLLKTAVELAKSLVAVEATTYNNKINVYGAIIKDIIVDARLTDTTDWYAVKANGALKPFIKLVRKAPELVSITSATSEDVFYRGEFVYSVTERYLIDYYLWQYAYKNVV